MIKLVIKPDSWECSIKECPPGFFVFKTELCFKTEYGEDEVFCSSGEVFWGGTKTKEERANLVVQPCIAVWEGNN
jgi:hypothetical protein